MNEDNRNTIKPLIHLMDRKVMFLGYGAVAKCTLHYLSSYFTIPSKSIYLVDTNPDTFYGPNLENVHITIGHVTSESFEPLLDRLQFGTNDIIIDLTFNSSTYFFIKTCLSRSIHYINTSIEDKNDEFNGESIDFQQQKVESIVEDFKKSQAMNCCILTEFGQNPGLIQHYVLYALTQLYQRAHPENQCPPSRDELIAMIDTYQIGSILMSERDQLTTSRYMNKNIIYNTWSVAGFVSEAYDHTELVQGYSNEYIKPIFDVHHIHPLTEQYKIHEKHGKHVFFLHQMGKQAQLPSVAPILQIGDNGLETLAYETFYGSLIHHGEVFELAAYFGEKAPFMSYVYQYSPYLEKSLISIQDIHGCTTGKHYMNYITTDEHNYCVFDNISVVKEEKMTGFDSIGCTLLCGKDKIERIFWCGTVLSDKDSIHPYFTPTTTQVAAGILSGLSWLMEPGRTPNYYRGVDLDTNYILEKAKPLLGKFFFTEIDASQFTEPFHYKVSQ